MPIKTEIIHRIFFDLGAAEISLTKEDQAVRISISQSISNVSLPQEEFQEILLACANLFNSKIYISPTEEKSIETLNQNISLEKKKTLVFNKNQQEPVPVPDYIKNQPHIDVDKMNGLVGLKPVIKPKIDETKIVDHKFPVKRKLSLNKTARKQYTPEDKALIKEHLLTGSTWQETAAALGRTPLAIYTLVQANKVLGLSLSQVSKTAGPWPDPQIPENVKIPQQV